jgi:hypothetical protein
MGMQITGTCNVNLIAGVLQEETELKHRVKQLHRMLLNSKILRFANKFSLKQAVKKISAATILALDIGDITHQYGKKFEKLAIVKDGSSGE